MSMHVLATYTYTQNHHAVVDTAYDLATRHAGTKAEDIDISFCTYHKFCISVSCWVVTIH